jgi:hypothetical protein
MGFPSGSNLGIGAGAYAPARRALHPSRRRTNRPRAAHTSRRRELPRDGPHQARPKRHELGKRGHHACLRTPCVAGLEETLPAVHVAECPDQDHIRRSDAGHHRGSALSLRKTRLAADLAGDHIPEELGRVWGERQPGHKVAVRD